MAGSLHLQAQTPTASSLQPENAEGRGKPVVPRIFLRDVVVSNTDPNLKNTDKFYTSEPGIGDTMPRAELSKTQLQIVERGLITRAQVRAATIPEASRLLLETLLG